MKKVLALVLALALVMAMFVACGKKTEEKSSPVVEPSKSSSKVESSSKEEAKYGAYSLACIYSEVTGDFWSIVYNGCMAALDELKVYGIEGYCIAPATGSDYTQQMDLLDTAVLEGADGIVLCPSNADAIGAYVTDKFTDDKTPIIVIDRSLNTSSPAVVGTYATDSYSMAQAQGQMIMEAVADRGEDSAMYCTLGINPENENWANRSLGCIDYINENADGKIVNIVDGDQPYWVGQVTQDICMQFIQDTINSNPGQLIVWCGTCNSYNNYAVAAISELSADKQEDQIILGWDFSQTEKGNIEGGIMYGSCGQNPFLMGYDSTYMMCDYLAGDKNAAVGKQVPYQIVTCKNMDSAEVKAYIETMGL